VQTTAWRVLLALAVSAIAVTSVDAARRAQHPARGTAHRPAHTRRAEDVCPRAGRQAVAVARVADGDTFFAGDGHEIDLAGVLAPGSGGERLASGQVQAARAVLERALAAGSVTLAISGQPDRYGRLKAQVFAGDDWVQARLVSNGLVRAMPDLISAPCAPALLAIEKRAREAGSGHWSDGMFGVQTPDTLRRTTGTFQIVEGAVVSGAVVKSRVYLNFGTDRRRDFTVTIAPEDMRNFRRLHVDWQALAGKRVRVRGWMEFYNGPMISLYAPGAIEFLDPMPKAPRTRRRRTPRAEANSE